MASSNFGWGGFALRFLFAIVLVALSYNPEGWSYFHWALLKVTEFTALKALAGMLLLIAWVVYGRATLRSLGPLGLVMVLGVFACLTWLLVDMNWVDPGSLRAVSYVLMFVVASVMAIGLSWSHVRRRLSGQIDADDVDE